MIFTKPRSSQTHALRVWEMNAHSVSHSLSRTESLRMSHGKVIQHNVFNQTHQGPGKGEVYRNKLWALGITPAKIPWTQGADERESVVRQSRRWVTEMGHGDGTRSVAGT